MNTSRYRADFADERCREVSWSREIFSHGVLVRPPAVVGREFALGPLLRPRCSEAAQSTSRGSPCFAAEAVFQRRLVVQLPWNWTRHMEYRSALRREQATRRSSRWNSPAPQLVRLTSGCGLGRR